MKSGFALIQVLIAVALSALISISLINLLPQAGRFVAIITEHSTRSHVTAVLTNQLEKDITSVFIPVQRSSEKEEKEKKSKDNKQQGLPKAFYGTNSDNNCAMLSFITTNQIASYQTNNPRITRVTYTLTKNSTVVPSFTLFRNESTDITKDPTEQQETTSTSYALVDTIKSFTVDYFVEEIEQKQPAEQQPSSKTDKKTSYKKLTEWDIDQLPEQERGFKRAAPNFVDISMVFWNSTFNNEYTLKKRIDIPSDLTFPPVPQIKEPPKPAAKPTPQSAPQKKAAPTKAMQKADETLGSLVKLLDNPKVQ